MINTNENDWREVLDKLHKIAVEHFGIDPSAEHKAIIIEAGIDRIPTCNCWLVPIKPGKPAEAIRT